MTHEEKLSKIEELIEEEKLEEAMVIADEGVDGNEEPLDFLNAKAVLFILQGKTKEAKALYQSAVIWAEGTVQWADAIYNQIEIAKMEENEVLAERLKYYVSKTNSPQTEVEKQFVEQVDEAVQSVEEIIINGENGRNLYEQLFNMYFISLKDIEACILAIWLKKESVFTATGEIPSPYHESVIEVLKKKENNFVLVQDSECRGAHHKILVEILAEIGEQVYSITSPIENEVESIKYNINELIKIITDNKTVVNNIITYMPLLLRDKAGQTLNTVPHLLTHIAKNDLSENSGLLLINVKTFGEIKKDISALTVHTSLYPQQAEDQLMLLNFGDFYCGMSDIYGFDIKKNFESEPKYKISVIIPVRNGSETLYYTVLTCLDQDFDDYEILISDNSDIGDERIKNLVDKLIDEWVVGKIGSNINKENRNKDNCPINYYKTPFSLPLNKSFEYAYLRAQGEFVFSIGADDGILIDSLSVLSKALDEYSDVDVIIWNRFSYFWPSAHPTQKYMLAFTEIPNNENVLIEKYVSDVVLEQALKNHEAMLYLFLPMAYINSGMRRRHIKKIIETTGNFIFGDSQDFYLGILNLFLCKDILWVSYPIGIAGLSGGSIGSLSSSGSSSLKEQKQNFSVMIGKGGLWNPITKGQRRVPMVNSDISLFYNQLEKVKDLELNPQFEVVSQDYMEIFKKIINVLNFTSLEYQMHKKTILQAAKMHGNVFYKDISSHLTECENFVKENIKLLDNIENDKKNRLNEQLDPQKGQVIIDGKELEITNIYDAIKYMMEYTYIAKNEE